MLGLTPGTPWDPRLSPSNAPWMVTGMSKKRIQLDLEIPMFTWYYMGRYPMDVHGIHASYGDLHGIHVSHGDLHGIHLSHGDLHGMHVSHGDLQGIHVSHRIPCHTKTILLETMPRCSQESVVPLWVHITGRWAPDPLWAELLQNIESQGSIVPFGFILQPVGLQNPLWAGLGWLLPRRPPLPLALTVVRTSNKQRSLCNI